MERSEARPKRNAPHSAFLTALRQAFEGYQQTTGAGAARAADPWSQCVVSQNRSFRPFYPNLYNIHCLPEHLLKGAEGSSYTQSKSYLISSIHVFVTLNFLYTKLYFVCLHTLKKYYFIKYYFTKLNLPTIKNETETFLCIDY